MSGYVVCAVLAALVGYVAWSVWAELDLIRRDFAANEGGKRLPQRVRRQSDRLVYRTHSASEDVRPQPVQVVEVPAVR